VLLVKMGNLEFETKRQYLTNDLDLADLASRNDAETQQAVAAAIAEQQAIYQARRDEENAALAQRQLEIEAERAAAAEASRYSNPLERGPYNRTYP
jgi:polysaccharide pyruvyl transferase WcaK-like protein